MQDNLLPLLNKPPGELTSEEWKSLRVAFKEAFNIKVSGCKCNALGVQRKLKKKLGYGQ
jgi:hypothetical protein